MIFSQMDVQSNDLYFLMDWENTLNGTILMNSLKSKCGIFWFEVHIKSTDTTLGIKWCKLRFISQSSIIDQFWETGEVWETSAVLERGHLGVKGDTQRRVIVNRSVGDKNYSSVVVRQYCLSENESPVVISYMIIQIKYWVTGVVVMLMKVLGLGPWYSSGRYISSGGIEINRG